MGRSCLVFSTVDSLPFSEGESSGGDPCVMEACTMFYYERERYMPSAVGLKYVGASRSQRNRIS